MKECSYYLLFDRVRIEGANAVSSPLTYGFPSVGAFLGAIHALSRKIKSDYDKEIDLDGVLIACHRCNVQRYRVNSFHDYQFKLTRNPLVIENGQLKTQPIIEEGRVDLEVSLLVEVKIDFNKLYHENDRKAMAQQAKRFLMGQRIAGGAIFSIRSVKLFKKDQAISDPMVLLRRLIPAFVLIDARQELLAITKELQQRNKEATSFDALIETAKLTCQLNESGEWKTTTIKSGYGWLVPIHLGYQGISPLFDSDQVVQTRDGESVVHFVEALYGMGKWVFPPQLKDDLFKHAFWRYHYRSLPSEQNNQDLYLVRSDAINN